MNPKVSIIIPVYNGENYLREAIDSALAQTYKNREILVINDGSTDGTEEIAKSYKDKIRYFSKENGGVSSALNLGIQNMTGEYFAWLSHDDVYYPQKIQKQLEALHNLGDMKAPLYGSADKLVMPERQIYPSFPEYRYTLEEKENGVFPVLFGLVNGCTVLIHRSHFIRVGLFDQRLQTTQDVDMWFRIFRNQRVVYIKEPLLMYRYHEEQGTKRIKEFRTNCQEIQLKMIRTLNKDEVNGIFGGYYKFYFNMMRMAVANEWDTCFNKVYHLFLNIDEPDFSFMQNTPRKKYNRLILYCAGKNGRYLLKNLRFWNIHVDFFVDGNSNLWNRKIDEIVCVSPNELEKDDCIIVTKDWPEDLVCELIKKGFTHVSTYANIARDLYLSVPPKRLVEEYAKKKYKRGSPKNE